MNTKRLEPLSLLILVLTMGTTSVKAQNNELYQGPIIDMHMHPIEEEELVMVRPGIDFTEAMVKATTCFYHRF